MSTTKHPDHGKKPHASPTSSEEGDTPNSPNAPASIGTGGAPVNAPPKPSPDPNQDIAREQATNTYNAKVAAGENPGEKPEEPESLAGQAAIGPTGPVPAGHKRMKVKSPIHTNGKTYEAGKVLDLPEAEAASLAEHLEDV